MKHDNTMTGEELGQKLLQAVREMQAGKAARVTQVELSRVTQVRHRTQLSQAQFAQVLGVSKRTLQDWEQGRRTPSGAAMSLLKIAERHPEVLAEVLG